MAQKQLPPELALAEIVIAAGGDPEAARYSEGVLHVPGVDQAALDAAAEAAQGFDLAPAALVLANRKAAAKQAVDAAAEATRLAFITDGAGQSAVYTEKAREAAAAEADPAPEAADYPLLSAEVGITAPDTGDMAADIKAVAAVVTAMRAAWLAAAATIEATRLGAKAAIDAAGDAAAIEAVRDGLVWPTPS